MSWITVIWSMVASACLTLAVLSLMVWGRRREARSSLIFAVLATAVAVYAGCELWILSSVTPAEYARALWWGHIPFWLIMVSLVGFVRLHLKAGRPWLCWTIIVLRTFPLIFNFVFWRPVNYSEITGVRQIGFLGETFTLADGVPDPWMLVGQMGSILLIIFVADATVTVWRRGGRRHTFALSSVILFFVAAATFEPMLYFWDVVELPITISLFFMGIVAAMGYDLSRDVIRASRLSRELMASEAELDESHQQLVLSASAANVGIWTRKIDETTIKASERWHEIFEFEQAETIRFDDHLQKIHPQDRSKVKAALQAAEDGGGAYDTEYRIMLNNGDIRWIGSQGKIEIVDGRPVRLRGASVDITKRKLAEEEAHDMSRKLMNAQEKERARLARELHDDLSQSLALLSIQLQVLANGNGDEDSLKEEIGKLTDQIQRLSSDVHRISHELHPAKLNQLGLESALRGFCRETAATHGLKIDFEAVDLPRSLPNDISLCLYRIAQESLQNIFKHSGASNASLNIAVVDGEIRLTVSDNGGGFDTEAVKTKESLGLVSMSERVRAVQGTMSVDSTIGAGTQIIVHVPITVAS